jgi:type IV pilus assembly protein PilE
MKAKLTGFTLIELMIVVTVVGILAGIAYPSYIETVRKSNRSDAKVVLNDVAQRMQRCFTAHSAYNPAAGTCTVVDELQSAAGVQSKERMYVVKIAIAADLTAITYLLTATPVAGSRQATDTNCVRFTLNQAGVRTAFKSGNVDNTAECW